MTDHDRIEDDIEEVNLVAIVQDAGTIIVFETEDGRKVAVDHSMAAPIAMALDVEDHVTVQAAPWQFI